MKGWKLGVVLVGLVPLTGASEQTDAPATMLGPSTSPLQPCDPEPDAVVGVIRIWLPRTINLSSLPKKNVRAVHFTAATKLADLRDPLRMRDDASENLPHKKGRPAVRSEPFHVYIRKSSEFGTTGHVAVRIIRPADGDYLFFDEGGIHGVGLGDTGKGDAICGSYKVVPADKDQRQVAMFLINLEALDRDRAFNIGVRPNDAPETPIFIDPKVRNEG